MNIDLKTLCSSICGRLFNSRTEIQKYQLILRCHSDGIRNHKLHILIIIIRQVQKIGLFTSKLDKITDKGQVTLGSELKSKGGKQLQSHLTQLCSLNGLT